MFRKIQGKRVYSVRELGDYFGVKPKTIIRWHRRISKRTKSETLVITDSVKNQRYLTQFAFQQLLSKHGGRVKIDPKSEAVRQHQLLEKLRKILLECQQLIEEVLD